MKLSVGEIQKIRQLQNEYGLNVSSIGSPIGKVKLADVEDGTKNAYVPFEKYLAADVQKACELAHAFETKLDSRLFVLPSQGNRSAGLSCPGGRPFGSYRRGLSIAPT